MREEFERNFLERGELGAACAIFHHGKLVADLWGGVRDKHSGAPWQQDTLAPVFSVSKGMAAAALAVAHSRGLFELDQPVAKYWPEFAQNGKGKITLRQLLAHQAGLCGVRERLDAGILGDLDAMAAILARQKPAWKPGTRWGYHGLSLGWYQNELMRRVDAGHRTLPQFFRDEIATPLGIEFYFAVPRDMSPERVAVLESFRKGDLLFHVGELPRAFVLAMFTPGSLTRKALSNPKWSSPAEIFGPEYRHVEMVSASGVGQVRAIAKVYGALAAGGAELGVGDKTLAELKASPKLPEDGDVDLVLHIPSAYAFGFMKPSIAFPYGHTDRTFGANGAGGAAGFADPDKQIGFAYASNLMGFHLNNDPRERALRDACYASLAMIERGQGFFGLGRA